MRPRPVLASRLSSSLPFARSPLGPGSGSPTRERSSPLSSKVWSTLSPPPDHQTFPARMSRARPYQLWRTVSASITFAAARSTSDSSCALYPLVATRACWPSAIGTMFSGRSVSSTCVPAGEMVQPLGRRNPRSVGPANRGGSWARRSNGRDSARVVIVIRAATALQAANVHGVIFRGVKAKSTEAGLLRGMAPLIVTTGRRCASTAINR